MPLARAAPTAVDVAQAVSEARVVSNDYHDALTVPDRGVSVADCYGLGWSRYSAETPGMADAASQSQRAGDGQDVQSSFCMASQTRLSMSSHPASDG